MAKMYGRVCAVVWLLAAFGVASGVTVTIDYGANPSLNPYAPQYDLYSFHGCSSGPGDIFSIVGQDGACAGPAEYNYNSTAFPGPFNVWMFTTITQPVSGVYSAELQFYIDSKCTMAIYGLFERGNRVDGTEDTGCTDYVYNPMTGYNSSSIRSSSAGTTQASLAVVVVALLATFMQQKS